MPNGTYGIKKPANIKNTDVDIFYHYRPTRDSDDSSFLNFKKLDSNLLTNVKAEDNDSASILSGMYNMRLPLDTFGKKGIYTLYIKPKELYGNIIDVSTLAAFPNIRGVVLDVSNIDTSDNSIFVNGNLVGYRIEYFNDDETKSDEYRIITSNNTCEPVAQNLNSSSTKGVKYRYVDSSSLIFCTLTPSTSLSFNTNEIPYMGKVGQKIALINTKFNPVMLEIEMVDNDIDTIYNLMAGDQIRDLNNGLITTFDDNGNIIHQASYGNIINSTENINHDFKIVNNDIISYEQEDDLKKIKQNI